MSYDYYSRTPGYPPRTMFPPAHRPEAMAAQAATRPPESAPTLAPSLGGLNNSPLYQAFAKMTEEEMAEHQNQKRRDEIFSAMKAPMKNLRPKNILNVANPDSGEGEGEGEGELDVEA
jgi:hypothetical protein